MKAADYKLPDGSIDFEKFRRDFEAADISPEDMRAKMEARAKITGKGMNDIVIECIRSGELSESETADAMEMLGQMPLSSSSDSTN